MRLQPGITVAIPVHVPRLHSTLDGALRSVWEQTRPPDAVAVAVDSTHAGAAATRNRALSMVRTEWTAFLDSDDLLAPTHLEQLEQRQVETGADVVYPHFTVLLPGGATGPDPFFDREGQPFDPKLLETRNTIPVTVLARTRMLLDVGGFRNLNESTEPGASPCEDFGAWRALLAAGAKFSALNARTWYYRWGDNTSGRGDRW